jgi:hypothetical protein
MAALRSASAFEVIYERGIPRLLQLPGGSAQQYVPILFLFGNRAMSRFFDRTRYTNTHDLAQAIADHIDRTSGGGRDVTDEPRVPKGSGRESGEWTEGGQAGRERRVALNWLEKQFVRPEDIKALKDRLDQLTNGALTQQQIDALAQQIIDHVSQKDARKLQSIVENNGRIELTPEQKQIIQNQIDQLKPGLREKVQGLFDAGVQSGTITCPECSG